MALLKEHHDYGVVLVRVLTVSFVVLTRRAYSVDGLHVLSTIIPLQYEQVFLQLCKPGCFVQRAVLSTCFGFNTPSSYQVPGT